MAKRFKKDYRRKDTGPQFRINHLIRVPQVRLVGDNLAEIGEIIGRPIEPDVYTTREAQDWANKMDLDLVEISPNANPPVCRIIDYKKFLYQKKKKEKDIKKKAVKTVIKEIRFGPNCDDHDFDFKVKHAQKFLSDNAKVKAFVHFRGRSIVFKERGELLLLKFIKKLEEYGGPEELPKMEGRRMIVVIAPKKVNKKKVGTKADSGKPQKAQKKSSPEVVKEKTPEQTKDQTPDQTKDQAPEQTKDQAPENQDS